ncbi:MAG: HAD superfamily hydrolase (TIGR01490 family) [Candidatus Azotimanducaceae bacterium]
MALTIFDLDETLIGIDSDHAWGGYVVDEGLVDEGNYRATNQQFFDDYKQGIMDVDAYMKFSCDVLSKYDHEFLFAHREKFINERIRPNILPKACSLIQSHQAKGDKVIVITATVDFITQAIVDLLGIDTLIAPVAEVVAGRYTGGIVGTVSIGSGKVSRLKEWLIGKDISMNESRFYSDSANDLPLLEKVTYPVAVDPDDKLAAIAKINNWPIISLR